MRSCFGSALAAATVWTAVALTQPALAQPVQDAPSDTSQTTPVPADPVPPDATAAPTEAPVAEPSPDAFGQTSASPAAATSPDAPGASETSSEVIVDPELEGIAPVPPPVAPPPPAEPNGQARAVLRSRVGMDVGRESEREDVVEATQIGLVELRVRRSERLRFAAGVRLRQVFTARAHDTPDATAGRYVLDAAPTAGYVDATLADGLDTRLGYQLVKLGRFEVLSATDVLSVYDLRGGPATMPEAADVAQPAVRIDWAASSAFALRAFYVPFFQPDPVSIFDTDYALARPTEMQFEQLVSGAAILDATLGPDDVLRILREGLSRSARDELARGGLSAFGPDPDFSRPQGGASFGVHGPAGEAALTVATALERLPAFVPSPALLAAYEDRSQENVDALIREPKPVRVDYGRFFVAALDGATAIGPVQLGTELAYQHDRVYLSASPDGLPMPEAVPVVQLGLRGEHATGGAWLLGVEGFGSYVLATPSDPDAKWLFVNGKRWRWGGVALVGFTPGEGPFTFELGGGVITGPSVSVLPRIEWRFAEGFFAELGAVFVEGRLSGGLGDPRATLGGLYDDVDQVFVGVGWRP